MTEQSRYFVIKVEGEQNTEDFKETVSAHFPEFPILYEGEEPPLLLHDGEPFPIGQNPPEKVIPPINWPWVEELDQIQSISDGIKRSVEEKNEATFAVLREIHRQIGQRYVFQEYRKYSFDKFVRDFVKFFEESVARNKREDARRMTGTSYTRLDDFLTPREIRVLNYGYGLAEEPVPLEMIARVEGLRRLNSPDNIVSHALGEALFERMEKPWTTMENLG